jgi:hypothetical protein
LFEPFDLSVLLGPDENVWVSAVSRAGAVHGVPRGGGAIPTLGELEDLTDDFLNAIATAAPQPATDLGAALRDLLFGEPEILGLFHHTRGVAADQGRQLLVRLLAAPRNLASVPWELTLDPDGGMHRFLSLAPYAHLVRAARSRTYPDRIERLSPPLNLLVVLSSPIISDLGDDFTFDLFEEKRNLLAELQPLADARLLNIDIEEHPTLENLRRRVGGRRYGYHLVHYVGHAVQTGLLLEDRFGRSRMVEAEVLNELLRLCPNLRLVLFAGCETARAPTVDDPATGSLAPADWRVRLSTADRCVRDSCPMVIGMQAVLPFRTEWLFTRFFYQAVTTGYSVVEAVRLARVAIRDDEYVGGNRLDWAVPSLIVGGGQPDVLVEPAPAAPPSALGRRAAREELKLDLVESDLEFFSRLVPLRLAVDVLTGSTADRVLVVTGSSGVGKTRLVDRALEDIGDRVDLVLYLRSGRLAAESDDADLLMPLCRWVAEMLTRRDGRPRQPAAEWGGRAWWDRLLQDLTGQRFVIVIDDLEGLAENPDLAWALSTLASRRARCRLALLGNDLPGWLLDADAMDRAAFVRLAPFTWEEVWRWIRRNHPVLTRSGKAGLAAYYPRLGSHLELWGQLAERVATSPSTPDLDQLVRSVAPRPRAVAAEAPAVKLTPRGQRPLRVAIAGPFVKDPQDFEVALTNYAAKHYVGGRALAPSDDTSSALGVLLPIDSPFGARGQASEPDIVAWLGKVEQQHADIVVLDYGTPVGIAPDHLAAIRRMTKGALVIAAAGNTGGRLTYPARNDAVLAVGALSSATQIAAYSAREPRRLKPELFASETLEGTTLKGWVNQHNPDGSPAIGTSFGAYQVAAAAILVWATHPERDPDWVRTVLCETATALPSRYKRFRPRALNLPAALERAREDLVTETLRTTGRLTLAELLAGVGLPGALTDAALQRLVARETIAQSLAAHTETYELIQTPGAE